MSNRDRSRISPGLWLMAVVAVGDGMAEPEAVAQDPIAICTIGDQVPLVLCYHHRVTEDEREPGRDVVLNLTPSGRIYRSDYDWRRHPDSVDYLLRTLERDLSQPPGWVLRTWLFSRVDASFLLGSGRRDGKDNPIFRSYFLSSLPTAFLIDSSGKIVWRGIGYGKEFKSQLEAAFVKLNLTPMTR